MRKNFNDDWKIANIEKVCKDIGLTCSPPSRGSHYKISSPKLDGILPIPARRPVKAPYIRLFVGLCDAHITKVTEENTL
jgi:hypothetical protein